MFYVNDISVVHVLFMLRATRQSFMSEWRRLVCFGR